MEQERRQFPRIDFHLGVFIYGRQMPSKIMNLSTSGALIHNRGPCNFGRGDEIELIMKLPLEKKTTRINAQVAHGTRDIGVKFTDLSPQNAMDIKYCFDVFKHTLPMPGT